MLRTTVSSWARSRRLPTALLLVSLCVPIGFARAAEPPAPVAEPSNHSRAVAASAGDVPGAPALRTRPTPPNGFAWVEFSPCHCAVLKPSGWHETVPTESDVPTLFLSKEPIQTVGRYRTGLSVNVIDRVREQSGMAPSQFAQRSLANATSAKEVLWRWIDPATSGLLRLGVRYRDDTPTPTAVVQALFVADDAADRLLMLVFNAPESEWEHVASTGETILTHVAMDERTQP
ncbi:MAG: hypothetical protein U0172_08300 [Nitrospiraceae bacterium]